MTHHRYSNELSITSNWHFMKVLPTDRMENPIADGLLPPRWRKREYHTHMHLSRAATRYHYNQTNCAIDTPFSSSKIVEWPFGVAVPAY